MILLKSRISTYARNICLVTPPLLIVLMTNLLFYCFRVLLYKAKYSCRFFQMFLMLAAQCLLFTFLVSLVR